MNDFERLTVQQCLPMPLIEYVVAAITTMQAQPDQQSHSHTHARAKTISSTTSGFEAFSERRQIPEARSEMRGGRKPNGSQFDHLHNKVE